MPDSAIGVEGRTVRCAKCRHSWFQEGDTSGIVPPIGAPAEAAEPAPHPRSAPETPAPVAAGAPATAEPATPVETRAEPAPAVAAEPAPAPVLPRFSSIDAPEAGRPAPSVALQSTAAPPTMPSYTDYGYEDDPLPPPPPPSPSARARAHSGEGDGAFYDDTTSAHYADENASSFDFAPPFRPRRNWGRIATIASVLFAAATLALTGAVAFGGLPDWLPLPRQTFSQAQPDLQLDFPRKRQDRKPLPDGSEFFSVSGTISNIGSETRYVPSLLVVLRDDRDRIVYEKEVVPSKRKLKPGEAITVNEALTDIPKAASAAEIGWKSE